MAEKVFDVRHTDGTHSEVTARSETEAVKLAQQMQRKAVDQVQFVRNVGDPANDFEFLQRQRW